MASSSPKNIVDISMNISNTKSTNIIASASIFVAIDTSGSMSGSKLNQVVNSLEAIISSSPAQVRFIIRVFNSEIKTLVTKKKAYLDLERLRNGVINSCGGQTALFDAWGQTIDEIPYKVVKEDFVHVLIFTDGEDNQSTKHNLNSIIELVNSKIRGEKRHLTFIQAGSQYFEIGNAIKEKCKARNCSIINVEDSMNGIKTGFAKAQDKICLELKFHFDANLAPDVLASNVTQQLTQLNLASQVPPSRIPSSRNPNFIPRPRQQHMFHHTGPRPRPRQLIQNQIPNPVQITRPGNPRNVAINNLPSTTSPNAIHPSKSHKLHVQYQIKIDQLPLDLNQLKFFLQEFFFQWGSCIVDHVEYVPPTSSDPTSTGVSAIILYLKEESCQNAFDCASRTLFHGNKLNVNKLN